MGRDERDGETPPPAPPPPLYAKGGTGVRIRPLGVPERRYRGYPIFGLSAIVRLFCGEIVARNTHPTRSIAYVNRKTSGSLNPAVKIGPRYILIYQFTMSVWPLL